MSGNHLRNQVRNQTLYENLDKLTNVFIEALDKPFFLTYGSWYDRVRTLIRGDPELIAKILEKRPDLEEAKLSLCLVFAKRCLEVLLEEDICRNPPHSSTETDYQDELALFLEKLFKERERILARRLFSTPQAFKRHFNEIFRREYLRYERYLYNETASDFLICPLQNLVTSKSFELESGISIRTIEQEEFHSLVEADESHGYEFEIYPEYVLSVSVSDREWLECLTRLVTVLRLLKKERIGLDRIYYAPALPLRPWKIIEAPSGTKYKGDKIGSSFNLSESDCEELKKLWTIMYQMKGIGYITSSIRRFNFAYERERIEDSWVDYFISLESLYSKESERTEVTHRLATRITRALEIGPLENMKKFMEKIKRWYGIRSSIVHGTQVSQSLEQLQDLEEIIRRSIKWFMYHKDNTDHNKIIDLLDLS